MNLLISDFRSVTFLLDMYARNAFLKLCLVYIEMKGQCGLVSKQE